MRSCVVPAELHGFLFDKSLHKTYYNLITKEMERKQEMKIKYERVNMARKKKDKRKNLKSKEKGTLISLRYVI
jgi:hypothetical protein